MHTLLVNCNILFIRTGALPYGIFGFRIKIVWKKWFMYSGNQCPLDWFHFNCQNMMWAKHERLKTNDRRCLSYMYIYIHVEAFKSYTELPELANALSLLLPFTCGLYKEWIVTCIP